MRKYFFQHVLPGGDDHRSLFVHQLSDSLFQRRLEDAHTVHNCGDLYYSVCSLHSHRLSAQVDTVCRVGPPVAVQRHWGQWSENVLEDWPQLLGHTVQRVPHVPDVPRGLFCTHLKIKTIGDDEICKIKGKIDYKKVF